MRVELLTELIKKLESSYPTYDNSVGRWHKNNSAYELHHVKIRDAYWQRRMLQSNDSRTAGIY